MHAQNRHFIAIIGIALVAAGIFTSIWFGFFSPSPSDAAEKQAPPTVATTLVFSRDGISGKISVAIDAVVRPRQATAAVCEQPGLRLICVLVEATTSEKYYELDRDLSEAQFPFLKELNFTPPPFPTARSMSIYRSEAKRVAGYSEQRDRLIVLICPKSEWAQIRIVCPKVTLPQPPAPPESSGGANSRERF